MFMFNLPFLFSLEALLILYSKIIIINSTHAFVWSKIEYYFYLLLVDTAFIKLYIFVCFLFKHAFVKWTFLFIVKVLSVCLLPIIALSFISENVSKNDCRYSSFFFFRWICRTKIIIHSCYFVNSVFSDRCSNHSRKVLGNCLYFLSALSFAQIFMWRTKHNWKQTKTPIFSSSSIKRAKNNKSTNTTPTYPNSQSRRQRLTTRATSTSTSTSITLDYWISKVEAK